jgi:uncharacterized membrane protein
VIAVLARSLSLTSLLLMGAIAGFFYAYWYSVMIGLDAAGPEAATAAMQGINATVRNAMFAPAFFGPLAVVPAAALATIFSGARGAALWLAAAFLTYAIGAFAVTLWISVPMNNAFAAASPGEWPRYLGDWSFWNGVRTVASFAALALVGLALTDRSRRSA